MRNEVKGVMIRNNPDMVYDMADTINLQYQTGGYQIYKTRTIVRHIASERVEDGSILIFGEYAFFLILKSLTRKNDFTVKLINCPFIKRIPVTDTIQALFKGSPEIAVTAGDEPECILEPIDIKSAGNSRLYRMSLSYRIELRRRDSQNGTSLSVNDSPGASYEAGSSGSGEDGGSVKVWRVESDNRHTVEQLLGIDQDTLKHFNKNHK